MGDGLKRANAAAQASHYDQAEFVSVFCGTHKGCLPDTDVTRIEWRYLDSP